MVLRAVGTGVHQLAEVGLAAGGRGHRQSPRRRRRLRVAVRGEDVAQRLQRRGRRDLAGQDVGITRPGQRHPGSERPDIVEQVHIGRDEGVVVHHRQADAGAGQAAQERVLDPAVHATPAAIRWKNWPVARAPQLPLREMAKVGWPVIIRAEEQRWPVPCRMTLRGAGRGAAGGEPLRSQATEASDT